MSDTTLFFCGTVISAIFVSGVYLFLRVKFEELAESREREPRTHRPHPTL